MIGGASTTRGARLRSYAGLLAGLGALATAYMVFESQWLRKRDRALSLPGLPRALQGLSILHLSDVHAGQPGLNLWTLGRAVSWAEGERPDVVVLTGDILGAGRGSERCLELLARLRPPLGMYAVTGNHEYGLSKNPFAHRAAAIPWEQAGITLLSDRCVTLDTTRNGETASLVMCGADYLTGGQALVDGGAGQEGLQMLLIHRPPVPADPLGRRFRLALSGHTHGGQIRLPGPRGPVAAHREKMPYMEGVHRWGQGYLGISRGIGTTFLPFRLLTRPEVILYRLTG